MNITSVTYIGTAGVDEKIENTRWSATGAAMAITVCANSVINKEIEV